MTPQEIHQILLEKFGNQVVLHLQEESVDPWIEIARDQIVAVSTFLKNDERLLFDHLNNLCGVDYCEPDPKKAAKLGHDPHVEVVYHLTSFTHRHRITIKVKLPRWENDVAGELPRISTVSDVWAIADWHERETYDLMGIQFLNHPNLRRILCPEDWVGHPLRKDYEFPLEYHGIRG